MADQTIRVLLADDHPVCRAGLAAELERFPGVAVVAECDNGRDALALVRAERPDVALLDLRMPGMDGVDVTTEVTAAGLPTRVLILSAHAALADVRAAFTAGAVGFLPKETECGAICDAVVAAAQGRNVVPPRLQHELAEGSDCCSLSARERQIIGLAASGCSVSQIATELTMSPSTVKTHLAHVYSKLGVANRAAAVAEAINRGLVAAEPAPR